MTVWARVTGWRFWFLVAIVLLDGVVFVLPLVGTAGIIAALLAPDWLRRAARFLDALADGGPPHRAADAGDDPRG